MKKRWPLSKRLTICLGISLGLIVLDFVSKWLVQNLTAFKEPIQVIPNFFYITKSYNTGVAFSLGDQLGVFGRILNIFISVTMSVLIYGYFVKKEKKMNSFECFMALLLGAGAAGNLIDRAFYWKGTTGFDGVIDFFQFYLGGGPGKGNNPLNPFPTFNLADAYLVVGVILLIIYFIIDAIKGQKKAAEAAMKPKEIAPKPVEEKNKEQNMQEEEKEASSEDIPEA